MSENRQNKHTQHESSPQKGQKDMLDNTQDSKINDESILTNENRKEIEDKPPRLSAIVRGANELSVGISIVVAILLGIGIGIGLAKLSGIKWLFWLGVFWGVAAAILNLYKAYQRQQKEAQELANNPRYTYKPSADDEDEDSQNGKYY
ncbi:AtpZ/AtpI family protein [Helicobacter sp. MIT 21-1697]|uniref:AtpZ/AtpI family protein n=1 Tax=Helicobacter sp. MIT 21-1697 TaxID=2993733 RepID=UPI00224A86D3|nr:AtpZ/AtpI family protein [Helicobacter sp. MIT 21-1697]MCX2716130.1 AtpZ/AtpI family protein [Helicobacter sp. MIT 21-1697]